MTSVRGAWRGGRVTLTGYVNAEHLKSDGPRTLQARGRDGNDQQPRRAAAAL